MFFSYDSAIRELKRLTNNGENNYYKISKRWYGWIIVDNELAKPKNDYLSRLKRSAPTLCGTSFSTAEETLSISEVKDLMYKEWERLTVKDRA